MLNCLFEGRNSDLLGLKIFTQRHSGIILAASFDALHSSSSLMISRPAITKEETVTESPTEKQMNWGMTVRGQWDKFSDGSSTHEQSKDA